MDTLPKKGSHTHIRLTLICCCSMCSCYRKRNRWSQIGICLCLSIRIQFWQGMFLHIWYGRRLFRVSFTVWLAKWAEKKILNYDRNVDGLLFASIRWLHRVWSIQFRIQLRNHFFFRIESLIYQWKKVTKDRDDVNDGSFDWK